MDLCFYFKRSDIWTFLFVYGASTMENHTRNKNVKLKPLWIIPEAWIAGQFG